MERLQYQQTPRGVCGSSPKTLAEVNQECVDPIENEQAASSRDIIGINPMLAPTEQ